MKKSLVLLIFFALWFPVTVWAHTGLEKAAPGEGETVKDDVRNIDLIFDTNIESSSTFDVRDQTGKVIKPSDIRVKGKTLSGILEEPLPPGEYTVHWRIIGADGHPVEGSYSFAVIAADKEKPTEKSASEKASQESPRKTEKKPAASPKPAGTPWVAGMLLALLIGAVAGLFWIWRKR